MDREIAKELASLPTPSTSNVAELPDLFSNSPLLQKAYERTSTTAIPVPEDGLQIHRYNAAIPPEGASEEDWQKALDTASSTLEHQYLRSANIELLSKFGANSWRISNFLLEKDIDRLAKEAEGVQQTIEDINRGRKQSQVRSFEEPENRLKTGVDGSREATHDPRNEMDDIGLWQPAAGNCQHPARSRDCPIKSEGARAQGQVGKHGLASDEGRKGAPGR